MSQIDAIVLAGGASRRMGTDKAHIVIDGRTLLQRSIDAVVGAGAERVVVVGLRGELEALPAQVRTVPDSAPGSGPLGGVVDGLRFLMNTDWNSEPGACVSAPDTVVIVVASDHPDHDLTELRYLVSRLVAEPAATTAVIPVVDGREQTMHAVYRPTLFAPLAASFSAGERSLRRALVGHPILRIKRSGVARRSYLDLDDPDQLAAYRSGTAALPRDVSG